MATSTTTFNKPADEQKPADNQKPTDNQKPKVQGISEDKAKAGWNTIMQHASRKGPASLREEAKGGKGKVAEVIEMFTGGKTQLLSELVDAVQRSMPSFQQGKDFLKEGEGCSQYMSKYFQIDAGALYLRSGSTTDRLAKLQDKLNNNEDSAKLAAMRSAPYYNTTDFFDLDEIFDFSIDQRKIFKAPEDFKWSKTTGSVKRDVAMYIMDTLAFYAECAYLSFKNLMKYYPKLLKDKIKLIKKKVELFKTSIKSKDRWEAAIKKNDVNLLFADPALESNKDKRENDQEYKQERTNQIKDAAEAAVQRRQNTINGAPQSGSPTQTSAGTPEGQAAAAAAQGTGTPSTPAASSTPKK